MKSMRDLIRDDIQGLRAIAVLSVFAFHLEPSLLTGGFIGVDIFFVISGFLISGIIIRNKESGRFSILKFYESRIRRITPAYFSALTIATIACSILFTNSDFRVFWSSLKRAAVFDSNSFFADFGGYFASSALQWPLLHTWTLAIEMKIYFILPIFLILIPIRVLKYIVPISMIGLFSASYFQSYDIITRQQQYYSTILRAPEFLLGTTLALHWATIDRTFVERNFGNICGAIGLIFIALSTVLISGKTSYPGSAVLLPCIGTALIICSRGSITNMALSTSALRLIGEYSYSIYLWHWIVLAITRYVLGVESLPWPAMLAAVAITSSLSYLSFRYVEQPFRRVELRRLTLRAIAIAVSFCSIAIASHSINRAIPEPEFAGRSSLDLRCHNQISGPCLKGDQLSSTEYLLIGDSHAMLLNPFFDYMGSTNGFRVRTITNDACLTIPGGGYIYSENYADSCKLQASQVNKIMDSYRIIFVAGRWAKRIEDNKLLLSDLESFMKRAKRNKTTVVFMADVPILSTTAARSARLSSLGFSTELLVTDENTKSNIKMKRIVEKYSNAKFLDLTSSEVFRTPPTFNGNIIYYDETHINAYGSMAYAIDSEEAFMKLLRKLNELYATQ
ncbi:acyltransferase family protein [Pseudomonas sp. abacavir_1]